MHLAYPPEIEIVPVTKPLAAVVRVPGSKSITNRAMVLAALCSRTGPCTLSDALQSEDTEVMVDCLTRLGFDVAADWSKSEVHFRENTTERFIPANSAELHVGNSGTTIRFVTAMLALGQGKYRLDGIPRMRERPIQDLLDALHDVGVDAKSETANGCPPVLIDGAGPRSTAARIRGETSSQFVSAMLMVAPYLVSELGLFQIRLEGETVSEPYIHMTESMMKQWGSTWRYDPDHRTYTFDFDSVSHYVSPERYAIEPDASSASYFFAAAAITGGKVDVLGMHREMLQGDVRFVNVLERMGCEVEYAEDRIRIIGPTLLHGVDVDMNAISDTVMTLAAVACFADGATTIRNVAHIRHKETDRIAAVATELRKLGAEVTEFEDGLKIEPKPMTGCAVVTYNDHRMAMSLALIGLRIAGVKVQNPGCVAKTYPGFWQDFEALQK